jgi:hypothetical protein
MPGRNTWVGDSLGLVSNKGHGIARLGMIEAVEA